MLIKSFSYELNADNEMTIYITDTNGCEYSVATISEVDEQRAREIALEVLEEGGYCFIEGEI